MFQTLASQIVLGLVILSVAFAWWKGGRPERVGSLFNGVICIGEGIDQAYAAHLRAPAIEGGMDVEDARSPRGVAHATCARRLAIAAWAAGSSSVGA